MAKKQLLAGIPQERVQSEVIRAYFPEHVDSNDDRGLLIGAHAVYPYDPITGKSEIPTVSPALIKTLGLTTAAGDTVLWAANPTKRIRIQGYQIWLASGTTAAAACTLTIKDGSTVLTTHTIGGVALVAPAVPVLIADVKFPGRGYLCAAANTAINLNLSSVLAVAGVIANIWGSEE
jgi:hypothetical protein